MTIARRFPAASRILGIIAGLSLPAIAAACGHTEPVANGDGRALAPTAEHSSAGPPGPLAEKDDPARGAGDAATLTAAGAPGGGGSGSELEAARCLADAGAPGGRTLVRFAIRQLTGGTVPAGCRGDELVLEVPSLGFSRQLCASACAPFDFETEKKGPAQATFRYANDFVRQSGIASVVDGVLLIEVHDEPSPGNQFGGAPAAAPPPRPPQAVPLPCGTRPEIQTAGRRSWRGQGPVKKSSL